MKNSSNTFQSLYRNFKRLVPFIGALFVAAGIIGLLFIQKPLETSQDTRSEAKYDETSNEPSINAELRNKLEIGKTGEIAFNLNKAGSVFNKVHLVFNIVNKDIDTPEVIVNLGSDYTEEKVEIQQINDGYLILVDAKLSPVDWFAEPTDKSLVRLKIVPRKSGKLNINFDKDRTYAETHNLDIKLKTPIELSYEIIGKSNSDEQLACSNSGGTWKEFKNSCADTCISLVSEQACLDVLTNSCDCGVSQCWDGTNCIDNPKTQPPPTSPPPTTPPVQGCNESCNTNADCDINLRCYSTDGQHLCRLAVNPSSTTCHEVNNNDDTGSNNSQTTLRSCNQFCTSNSECVTGLTCYESFCRNPENPQDNRCVAPTVQQTQAIIQSCNEGCSTNRDCANNLRCYEGTCRLATNVSSTSCSAVTKKIISDTYSNKAKDATDEAGLAISDTPLKGGSNSNGQQDENIQYEAQKNALVDKKIYDDSYEADETLLDLLKNLITNPESKLPFFIILFGILLLVLSILVAIVNQIKKSKKITYKTNPENHKIDLQTYDVKPGERLKMQPNNQAGLNQSNQKAKELLKTLENQPKA